MKDNIIEITEEVKLPGTDIILEKGDKIKVLKEAAPLIGTLVGKTVVEVLDKSQSFGFVQLLFDNNQSIRLHEWNWYMY